MDNITFMELIGSTEIEINNNNIIDNQIIN